LSWWNWYGSSDLPAQPLILGFSQIFPNHAVNLQSIARLQGSGLKGQFPGPLAVFERCLAM
jgi:hypothetical protein